MIDREHLRNPSSQEVYWIVLVSWNMVMKICFKTKQTKKKRLKQLLLFCHPTLLKAALKKIQDVDPNVCHLSSVISLWLDSPGLRIKPVVFLTTLSSAESSPSPPSPPPKLNDWHFPKHSMPSHTPVLKPIMTSAWKSFPFLYLCFYLAKFHSSFRTWFKLRLPLPSLFR